MGRHGGRRQAIRRLATPAVLPVFAGARDDPPHRAWGHRLSSRHRLDSAACDCDCDDLSDCGRRRGRRQCRPDAVIHATGKCGRRRSWVPGRRHHLSGRCCWPCLHGCQLPVHCAALRRVRDHDRQRQDGVAERPGHRLQRVWQLPGCDHGVRRRAGFRPLRDRRGPSDRRHHLGGWLHVVQREHDRRTHPRWLDQLGLCRLIRQPAGAEGVDPRIHPAASSPVTVRPMRTWGAAYMAGRPDGGSGARTSWRPAWGEDAGSFRFYV